MDIRIVDDDIIIKETIDKYLKLKSAKKEIEAEMDNCLTEFLSYSTIDLKSDFEGKVNLIFGGMTIALEYKFNRTIDKDKLSQLCKKTGKPAQTYANVKFEYPTKTMIKDMDKETIDAIDSCTKKSRAKTSVNISI